MFDELSAKSPDFEYLYQTPLRLLQQKHQLFCDVATITSLKVFDVDSLIPIELARFEQLQEIHRRHCKNNGAKQRMALWLENCPSNFSRRIWVPNVSAVRLTRNDAF